ncbi:MAG TPA: L,D-transpeptidase family protein [Pseudolabrys sp.]|nr:L,D-transpeptidase family protein [Pseudolabrys sp.]
MRRSFMRALLASAAITAAVALSACNPSDIPTNGRAMAPLSERTIALISEKNMDKQSPILVRVFKEEAELEVWKQTRDGQYALLKTYPICKWSGDLGPKKKEGDRQAPEGFYAITPGLMNPNSNYYLAFNTGFPNAYDRAHNYTGSELMVHGDCSSRGCYAMTDEQIQEIYALARESFFGGQKSFQFDAFPFRMTALNMAKHRNNPNFAFWKMLKEGYDNFEATKQPPQVAVCEQRYLFDQVDKDGQALSPRNARAACPVHKLDPQIADAVLEHRRDEQTKMANYIAEGVQIAAAHVGDGGMNPVFADKLETQTQYDAKGQLVQIAVAPGALPKVPNPPGTTIPRAQVQPEQQPAETQPEQSQQPIALASVPKREAAPKPAVAHRATNALALRGTNTELAAKPKRVSTADPKEVAKALAATRTHTAAAKPAESDVRTAYSTATIAGAQPAMPVGSFDARWGGLR